LRFKRLRVPALLCVSIAAFAASEDKQEFRPKPAGEYPHRQTSEKVTIAAQPYVTDDQAKEAFGKVNPWRYGVLPVLIVIQNDTPHALRLNQARFTYVLPDRSRTEATPAGEVRFAVSPKRPREVSGPLGAVIRKGGKNPLAEWEIEGRALAAKMIPAGESASGFVYFQAPQQSDAASVYITGLVDAVTSQELYYFEIPMSGQ
jgi:hypothetical protein